MNGVRDAAIRHHVSSWYSTCVTRLAIATVTVFLLTGCICNDGPMDGTELAAFQPESGAAYTQQQLEQTEEPDDPTFMLPDQ